MLFIRTDRLGETLLNLPAVSSLRAALPQASLTLLVHPDLQPLLDGLPGIDEVLAHRHELRHGWWRRARTLGRTLRPRRFDVAVVSNPMKELHVAVWLAGIPCRVGYDRKWGCLLTHRLPDRKALGERHEVEYNLDLVRRLGLPTLSPQWQFPRFEREQVEAQQLLERQGIDIARPFIAVHPWTSNPIKRWPLDRYQMLIRQAVERLRLQIVVIGGAEEAGQTQAVLPAGLSAVNLVGKLSLRQVAGLLQLAALLVSNDSGPMHLAAAAGTRTLALFGTPNGAAGPRRWGPWGRGHVVISKPSMESITVNEVFDALQQMCHSE